MQESKPAAEEIGQITPGNGRNPDGTFATGHSGTFNSKYKGMAAYIKAKVGDNGEKLADFFYDVMTGFAVNGQIPKLSDRVIAATYLSDRAFGKPTQLIAGDADKEPIQISFSSQIPRPNKEDLFSKPQSPVDTEK